ncbi:MAG: hypothetical protein EBT03_08105 [Betaproteobacteria bacterium]|nr:hypothetical protein [Betaproteobacteria bacterium]NCA16910.1 hypothetical protein [Betaproteobacteria bacterium]
MKAASPDRKFSLLLAKWRLLLGEYPELRPGQALWNVAVEMYDINQLFGGHPFQLLQLDTFNNDRAIPKLLHFLLWQNQEEDT